MVSEMKLNDCPTKLMQPTPQSRAAEKRRYVVEAT
jgi:hypothetical protein